MTDRAEIERLLSQTGRTLEGLPETYSSAERAKRFPEVVGNKPFGDVALYQSDVIELLFGALRDALDKPMQKPLTKREVHALIDAGEDVAVYCESINDDHAYATIFFSGNNVDRDGEVVDNTDLIWHSYGADWRCWASKPTDEERSAAAWES